MTPRPPPSHHHHHHLLLLLLLALATTTQLSAFLFPHPHLQHTQQKRIPTSSSLYAKKKTKSPPSSSSPPPPVAFTELGNTIPPPPPPPLPTTDTTTNTDTNTQTTTTEESGNISPSMYDKLRSEATTPFRSLRMFIYGGFSIGAGLGGYTAITQLVQSVNHMQDALPLSQAVTNVLVDVGVLAASAFAWNFENNLKKVTDAEMMDLRAKEPYKLTFDIKKERERALSALPITIQVGVNQTMTSSVKELREKGGQHLIVLAAPKAEMADALLGARIGKTLFAKNDVMIAPFVLKDEVGAALDAVVGSGSGGGVKGFGKSANEALLDKEAYVAKPAVAVEGGADAWKAYIDEELSDALKQGNDNARKRGIGIVMRKDGTIIRRGLGSPEWREVVAELTGAKSLNEMDDSFVPIFPSKPGEKKKK